METSKLRKSFLDICQGYSKDKFQGRDIYFKHVSDSLQIELDEYEAYWLNRILKFGTPNEKQALNNAYKKGTWTVKQEKNLEAMKTEYMALAKVRVLHSVRDIDAYFEERERKKAEVISANLPRFQALGLYAEKSAAEAAYTREVQLSAFSDPECKIPFSSDYEYWEPQHVGQLENLYYNKVTFLKADSFKEVKKIVCQDFFSHKFSISENACDFLQVPPWKLSELQTFLVCFGKKFLDILPRCLDAPDHFWEEPEKLEFYAATVKERGEVKKQESFQDSFARMQKIKGK